MTGTIHTAFSSPIQWESKKLQTITLSTCEAEYVAASHTMYYTLCNRRLLNQIHEATNDNSTELPPTTISTDSLPAITMANHEGITRRRKNIDVKIHHLAHHLDSASIKLQHIDGAKNSSDYISKAFGPTSFQTHMKSLTRLVANYPSTPNDTMYTANWPNNHRPVLTPCTNNIIHYTVHLDTKYRIFYSVEPNNINNWTRPRSMNNLIERHHLPTTS